MLELSLEASKGKTVEIGKSKFGDKKKYKGGRVSDSEGSWAGIWRSGARIAEGAALLCSQPN